MPKTKKSKEPPVLDYAGLRLRGNSVFKETLGNKSLAPCLHKARLCKAIEDYDQAFLLAPVSYCSMVHVALTHRCPQ